MSSMKLGLIATCWFTVTVTQTLNGTESSLLLTSPAALFLLRFVKMSAVQPAQYVEMSVLDDFELFHSLSVGR